MASLQTFKVGETPGRTEALGNMIYANPKDFQYLFGSAQRENYYVSVLGHVFTIKEHRDVKQGSICFNKIQRVHLQLAANDNLSISPFFPDDKFSIITICKVEASLMAKRSEIEFDAEKLSDIFYQILNNHIFTVGQKILLNIGENIIFTVNDIESLNPKTLAIEKPRQGLMSRKTKMIFSSSPGIKIKGNQGNSSTMLIKSDWNFSQMGIGGLDTEFSEIFRRAFASRIFPAAIVAKLGIKHVKGILLHGPPGTGKTLMARKIGEMLQAKSLKIVNGPEILNQYVGKSEENVRNLFLDAEMDQKKKGDESDLHIIIFDEIDAICKSRGSTYGGTGVSDSVVNQLLSKIDGVNALNNVLIIGMTNRKDMIDEALLRPGRLEVHMEIGLPDEKGRLQILKIHTQRMRDNNFLDGVDLDDLAIRTKNYTGAELEGLVKNASSYAFSRQLDATQLTKAINPDNIKITNEDFLQALNGMTPAFGASTDEFEGKISNGIIDYGERFQNLLGTCRSFVKQVQNSDRTPLVSFLLEGPIGSGKTALAATLAVESKFPFVKLLSAESMIGLNEFAKCQKISKVFQDTNKSPLSVVVLDDIERLLEYVPIGHRFSNALLQTLLGCLKRTPKGRKLLIIGTTSNTMILEEMGVLSAFNSVIAVPKILPGEEMKAVLQSLNTFNNSQIQVIAKNVNKSIPIRTIIMINEMARQDASGDELVNRFLEFAGDVGESGAVRRQL